MEDKIKFSTECKMVSVNDLTPYAKNPKEHTDKDIDLIIRSIKRNGWGDPILLCPETNEILSGNGRYLAAKKMSLDKVPVVYAPKGLSEKQKADLVIASNKLVEVSGYNDNLTALVAEFDLDISDFGMVAPTHLELLDEEEAVKQEIEKRLCQCPACGHINEEKAFRYHADSE
jgi:ParB-like chromosome segregation protein Spo0J